ncbi:MAG: BolA/IbaG family iron-sulfur metabolism protein [Rhodocyclaceae bacterium]|nr:BolA/IbaG family iron-sulfur metabolism protein [Rhodocyclaceae bacterium]
MLTPAQIEAWIRAELEVLVLEVQGDGRHFEALIVSPEFRGLSRVARQQRVHAILMPHFADDRLHALSMKCLTPEEAASQDQRRRG